MVYLVGFNVTSSTWRHLDFATYDDLVEFLTARGASPTDKVALDARIVRMGTAREGEYSITAVDGVPYPPGTATYGKRHAGSADDWMYRACLIRYRFLPYVDLSGEMWTMDATIDAASTLQFAMSCNERYCQITPYSTLGLGSDYRRFMTFALELYARRKSVWLAHGRVCTTCEELSEWEDKIVGDEIELSRAARVVETEGNRKRLREAESELKDFDAETMTLEAELDRRESVRVEMDGRVVMWVARNI